jgi:isoleucyl-tRNA synthetase
MSALEAARQNKIIGKSLEAQLEIHTNHWNQSEASLLAELCIVSHVDIIRDDKEAIIVLPVQSPKCERCWKHDKSVGTHSDYPTLCTRCAQVVREFYTTSA